MLKKFSMKKTLIKKITKKNELTVLIPTYNEEYSIGKLINEINFHLKNSKIKYCLMITDNDSKDRTLDIISKKKKIIVNRCLKRGYGANLLSAIKLIQSKYTIFFDADGSYDPKHIKKLFYEIKCKDYDLVTYNRIINQEKGSMPFLNKYLGTPVLSFLIRTIYGIKVYDNNAGMRIFQTQKFKELNLKCSGMEFASEILIKMAYKNLKYKELILRFRKDYRNTKPHLKPWSDGLRHLICIFLNIFKSPRFRFFK